MKYYYHPWSPNCRKTTALIDHLAVEAERVVVDLAKGEQMAPEFLAVNPSGMVPTLEEGDTRITESNAITIYLAVREGSELWPVRRMRQLEVLQWMFWEQSHYMFACGTVFFNRIVKPMIGQQADEARVEEAVGKFRRHSKVLDDVLASHSYLIGDALSLADWAVAGHLSTADMCGLPVADFPNLQRWLGTLDDNPAWKASAPQMA
jgi:glutathione S-transferase